MRAALALALATLSGCTPLVQPDGSLVLFFSDLGGWEGSTTRECTENLQNASCPAAGEEPGGEWTNTTERERTGAQGFAQVFFGEKLGAERQCVLVTRNRTYACRETRGGGVHGIVATREADDIVTATETHSSGYEYTRTTGSIERVRFDLVVDRATGAVDGALVIEVETTLEETESDAFDPGQVGNSQWNPFGTLDCTTGNCLNYPAAGDCSTEPCQYAVTTLAVQTATVSGYVLLTDDFDDVDGASQAEGDAAW